MPPLVVLAVFLIQALSATLLYAYLRTEDSRENQIGFWLVVGVVCALVLGATFGGGVLLQTLAITFVGAVCLIRNQSSARFLGGSTAAAVLIFLCVGAANIVQWRSRLAEFPAVSLNERLAYESDAVRRIGATIDGIPVMSDATDAELAEFEMHFPGTVRAVSLRMVHASMVEQFVKSPGFGVGRMIPLGRSLDRIPAAPIPQPATLGQIAESAEPPESVLLPPEQTGRMDELHADAQLSFVNHYFLGYKRDDGLVVGFESHAFQSMPDTAQPEWNVLRVELLSLLKHDPPGVYVSENLPRMDELREGTVRPLDAFETRSLPILLGGENLAAERVGDRVRMLGAIRAAHQCLECHTLQRGALLGAFSYVLQSGDPPLDVKLDPPEPLH